MGRAQTKMKPAHFKPQTVEDLIGPALKVGRVLLKKCEKLKKDGGGNVKLLFYGPAGVAKSELAWLVAMSLAGSKWDIEVCNGKEVNINTVKDWMLRMGYGPGYGGQYAVKLVNELDCMSRDAQELILSYLDLLPPHRAFIGTSNLQLDMLQDRFQSRMQQFRVLNPTTEELTDWLCKRWKLPLKASEQIAVGSGGNVRAALLDAQSWLDCSVTQ